jgi:phage terminase large subunit-like protein
VVAVDPNASSEERADEAGITVHGLGHDGRGYLLADRSAAVGPIAWARRALEAAHEFEADSIVGEPNNGGEMVRLTIEAARRDDPSAWRGRVKLVSASRGKRTRAEPIAMLHDQGRIAHATCSRALRTSSALGRRTPATASRSVRSKWGLTVTLSPRTG